MSEKMKGIKKLPVDGVLLKEENWKFLVALEDLKHPRDFNEFLDSLQASRENIDSFITYLKKYNFNIKIEGNQIYPLEKEWKKNIDFTFSEWVAFQTFWLLQNNENEDYFHSLLKNKFQYSFEAKLFEEPQVKLNKLELWSKIIDRAIVKKTLLNLTFFNNKIVCFYPHRLVYLDGSLCVIGEDKLNKILAFYELEEFANIEESEYEFFEARFTPLEINDFIHSSRVINGKEERVVIKIFSQENIDLLPRFHHLGNPFVTSNGEGDLIWAATIEICEDFYKWLYQMKDSVEILDPGHIRREFSLYCEHRKLIDTKKAG